MSSVDEVFKEVEDMIPPKLLKELPPRREVDKKIELEHREKPPELEELRKKLCDLLKSGLIQPSKATYV